MPSYLQYRCRSASKTKIILCTSKITWEPNKNCWFCRCFSFSHRMKLSGATLAAPEWLVKVMRTEPTCGNGVAPLSTRAVRRLQNMYSNVMWCCAAMCCDVMRCVVVGWDVLYCDVMQFTVMYVVESMCMSHACSCVCVCSCRKKKQRIHILDMTSNEFHSLHVLWTCTSCVHSTCLRIYSRFKIRSTLFVFTLHRYTDSSFSCPLFNAMACHVWLANHRSQDGMLSQHRFHESKVQGYNVTQNGTTKRTRFEILLCSSETFW